MKRNLSFIVILTTLMGLTGCSDDNSQVAAYSPRFSVEYVDSEGNNLIKDINNPAKRDSENAVEVLSITGNDSKPVDYRVDVGSNVRFNIDEPFTFASPQVNREYTVKYKIPNVLGDERIEEIKLKFSTPGGGEGRFNEVWYNGERIVNQIETDNLYISSNTENELDNINEELRNKIYNGGNSVAVGGSYALIVLPVNL